uniref:NADH-ubiquinone oxidoreductase chain 6 n=1 Tax=Wickerhamomyces mucosus TaxID=1378264 RepID=S5U5Z4_9ASCO|nr:NADH dehydrogenase subunit 6 [Wickerhamomyces mucosus]AGS44521.1 NADH dehydrogenase subunit 6 [Wickerhamomyces mucosus]
MFYNIINIDILNINIFGLLSIISAISIIIVSNPMYSILNLIFLFINIAIYLYLIGISIMSLLYLLVYIGAIAVLFLFILSLLDIKITELNYNINNNNYPIILLIVYLLYNNIYNYYSNIYNTNIINTKFKISEIFINNWNIIYDFNHLNEIGFLLYTEYSILFIILSILLLFSIVSAIVLTLNK